MLMVKVAIAALLGLAAAVSLAQAPSLAAPGTRFQTHETTTDTVSRIGEAYPALGHGDRAHAMRAADFALAR